MAKRKYHILLISFFLLFIFSGFVLFLAIPKEKIDVDENRALSPLPALNLAKLDPYPRAFENYYNDHFPFRNKLIKGFNKLNFFVLKKSPNTEQAIIGKDGWLFMNGNEYTSYTGNPALTSTELKSIENELIARQKFCSDRGIKFYTIIVPSKYSVYPENLYPNWKNLSENNHRNQLMNYFKNKKEINIFDITEKIVSNKDIGELYYKTDNHWNDLGSFYSVQAVMNILKKDFPQLSIPSIEDYTVRDSARNGGNIAQMISMQNELPDIAKLLKPKKTIHSKEENIDKYAIPKGFAYGWDYEVRYKNEKAPKVKLLLIRESFGTAQVQFFSESFGESIYIFDAWKHQLNPDIIDKEKPDIVIIQIMEGFISNLVPETE